MPRVSGRFDSAAKYLMVCGLPSSKTVEVVFGQVGDERAMLIFDIEEKSNDVDVDFQGLAGPWSSGFWASADFWPAVVEFQGPGDAGNLGRGERSGGRQSREQD